MQADNTLAGDIFGDMVLEQAIADKTAMVQAEIEAAQMAEAQAFGIDGPPEREAAGDDEEEEDPDFAMDEDEERMLRQMALDRMEAARAEHKEERQNIVRGHGTYNEITEQEFLPTVT